MYLILQLLSVLAVFALTYLFFVMVGRRGEPLLASRTRIIEWQNRLGDRLGFLLTTSNIFATVTSLATVYLYFIGSSKIFGAWTFLCCITILIGGVVSNALTAPIARQERPRLILESDDQRGAILASLFWGVDPEDQAVSRAVRIISLIGIGGIVWLEFSLFGDITGRVLGLSTSGCALIVWVVAVLVFWFTFRYGLRGFVLADLLHTFLIIVGISLIVIGTGVLFLQASSPAKSMLSIVTPVADTKTIVLFAINIIVVNGFIVLTSETHWLRLWVFSRRELTAQIRAQMFTSIIWAGLILVGLTSYTLTESLDSEAVAKLLMLLSDLSPVFLMAFWIGATAALFSTTDSQIYCFRLVRAFDVRTGVLRSEGLRSPPSWLPVALATITASIYFLVRSQHIPFDKIVFTLLPITLNIVPALVLLATGRRASSFLIYASMSIYLLVSLLGFFASNDELAMSLAAALVPIVMTVVAHFSPGRNYHADTTLG